MGEVYSENLVSKELAKCIGDYVDKASRNFSYAKGYKGRVESGADGVYKVTINGVTHTVRTDYVLNEGDYVTLLSLQNQNGDYAVIPTAKQIKQTIAAD
jgi:hypothetical protein